MSQESKLTQLFEAESLHDRGKLCLSKGQLDEAERLFKRALELKEASLGPEDPAVSDTLDGLGTVCAHRQNWTQAEEYFKRALAIVEKAYYPAHAGVARALECLAACYAQQSKWSDAEPLFKQLTDVNSKCLSGDHRKNLEAMRKLVATYRHLSKFTEAETILKKALTAVDTPLGPTEELLYEQALLFQAQGKNTEAETAFKKVIDGCKERWKMKTLLQCLHGYAEFLRQSGRSTEAEQMDKRADQISGVLGQLKTHWLNELKPNKYEATEWYDAGIFPATLIRA